MNEKIKEEIWRRYNDIYYEGKQGSLPIIYKIEMKDLKGAVPCNSKTLLGAYNDGDKKYYFVIIDDCYDVTVDVWTNIEDAKRQIYDYIIWWMTPEEVI